MCIRDRYISIRPEMKALIDSYFKQANELAAQGDTTISVSYTHLNYMSALMSGACILFLFWSITHLVRKLIITDENNITKGQLITVMGSCLLYTSTSFILQKPTPLPPFSIQIQTLLPIS